MSSAWYPTIIKGFSCKSLGDCIITWKIVNENFQMLDFELCSSVLQNTENVFQFRIQIKKVQRPYSLGFCISPVGHQQNYVVFKQNLVSGFPYI